MNMCSDIDEFFYRDCITIIGYWLRLYLQISMNDLMLSIPTE